jgi:hypothetical protein
MGLPPFEEGKDLDPRVSRTRKMLQDPLAKLLKAKEFDEISIGDIAVESTLNRATHYPHKLALLQCLVSLTLSGVDCKTENLL